MTTTTLTAAQSGDHDDAGYSLAYAAAAGPRERDFLIQIGSEIEYVEWRGNQFARPWQVIRGYLGTAVADHAQGATVTVEPAIGGGGLSVDNGTDPPTAVTTLVAPGATIAGDTATVISMPTLILHDATGGTVTSGHHSQYDPTPVTNYSVVRDDIGAATDLSNYPVFPAGLYIVGGYISIAVPGATPTGLAAADISLNSDTNLPPQGDLGYTVRGDFEQMSGVIAAPVKMAWLPAGSVPNRRVHMRLFTDLTEDILWLDWVFWAIRIADVPA